MMTLFLRLLAAGLPVLLLAAPGVSAQTARTFWWNDCVFYEVFVRSFHDSNGNGIGDLQGLIQKLDYLNDGNPATTSDLGVTGIWLMPVSPSPSYHGYDVTDYRGIESDYGTRADFEAFVAAAHARGIRVVVDFVMNHSSSQHPWFTESASGSSSPRRDWYIWENTNPGYTGPWGQQVWHLRNGAWYFGLFWGGMPDLNYWNPEVKSEMFDVARYWLDTLGVDGFRLDAIKHLFENGTTMQDVPATFTFLQELRQFTKGVKPDAVNVGEVWSATSQVAPYSDSTRLDFCFEFDLGYAVISAVNTANPLWIINKMAEVTSTYRPLQYAPFLTNHDQDRVFGQVGQDADRMKLAAAVYLTLPGIPFMYYGEEVGMLGSGQDENKRRPMQWTAGANAGFTTGSPWYPLNSNFGTFNVATMQADSASLWHWYRRLVQTRNRYEALRRGGYAQVATGSTTLYGYARSTEEELIVVLHNFGTGIVAAPVISLSGSGLPAGSYDVQNLFGGTGAGQVQVTGSGGFTSWAAPVSIPPEGTAILRVAVRTTGQQVAEGWNLLALPLRPADPRPASVYPSALSGAFTYGMGAGYTPVETLRTARGYWVKFPTAAEIPVTGEVAGNDTIGVDAGWNLVGALSSDLPVADVVTIPPGIIASAWFEFSEGAYSAQDSLRQGMGYWVKCSQPGLMILDTGAGTAASAAPAIRRSLPVPAAAGGRKTYGP